MHAPQRISFQGEPTTSPISASARAVSKETLFRRLLRHNGQVRWCDAGNIDGIVCHRRPETWIDSMEVGRCGVRCISGASVRGKGQTTFVSVPLLGGCIRREPLGSI